MLLRLTQMIESFLSDTKCLIISIGWLGVPPRNQRGEVRWEN